MDAWLHGCMVAWGGTVNQWGWVKDGQLSLVISHWEIGEDLLYDCMELGCGLIVPKAR